ncbi:MAG TPA: YqjK family protein [Burkholderiaceae bacterium]|jgi:hypothetical protein|nr:YqjK family protein [Burkholderiaceae bacterium]
MKMQANQLAKRRQELVVRCSEQRESLVLQSRRWSAPMSTLDAVLVLLGRIRAHPDWLIGLAAALIAIKPRRLASVAQAGKTALRTWATVAPVVHTFQKRR